MDAAQLTFTAPIENATTIDMFELFSRWTSLEGKRCLCIGFDAAQLQELILKYQPAEVKLLTLWAEHKDAAIEGFEVVVGDITQRTPFEDQSFDAVVTLSLLEHIADLDASFKEIDRLLKPGGYFGSLFGPSWSCHIGHHLYSEGGNPLFDFWLRGMPAHMHLLCSREEVRDWYLQQGATKEQAEVVLHWMFDTQIINRRFFDDYMELFSNYFQMVGFEFMYAPLERTTLELLRSWFPGRRDFTTYGGKFLLRKYG